MLRPRFFYLLALSLLALVWIGGCDKSAAKNEGPPGTDAAGAESSAKEKEEAATIAESLAKLSAEDRQAAELQKFCPVSDEKLGTMDAPYKVTVNGQEVFLCCSGCEDALKKEPEKYLAKLKK